MNFKFWSCLFLTLAFSTSPSFELSTKKAVYQLSTHILDISNGVPAPNVLVHLYQYNNSTTDFELIDKNITDTNGRIGQFLEKKEFTQNIGIYKLRFFVEPYFTALKTQTFFPYVDVVFQIKDCSHYHVPITLSNYGYSTYRGS